jgi:hypothetical protein
MMISRVDALADQQGCSSGRLAVRITDHVPAVRVRHEALVRREAPVGFQKSA